MPQITIDLARADYRALAAHGLKLAGLGQTGRLDAASRFEGPTSVLAGVTPGAFLDIGAFCNLSGGTLNNLRVGPYCSIAAGVVTGTHEHPSDWLTTSRTGYYPEVNGWDRLMAPERLAEIAAKRRPFPASCPVTTLGPDVWIGQGAFLKSGITVGTGAIIGARATVVKDVPPYAIVVGTPGRVLRLRFPEPVIERLLASQWWRYSIYDLFDAPMDDIERALDVIEDLIAKVRVAPHEGPVVTAADLADPATLLARLAPVPLAESA
ncbi:transferase family hexapeptide repeat protein [Palleronia aestuarii]|uniref:Transferase family hexapeptide repeat protein n=1 Tax=Palleronia aestuarii TaxID=568105 RepID=A0A2W7NKA9_9RHOB|nr:CatB-related O-acetyltransferase [Palleronia aestuarii]PZX17134.1 transferase family hexapeptide repeat protein [Palleronia aestuarii]